MGMSYESPIEVITSHMKISSERAISGEVVKAVQKVGINVDKAELLRALAYDRGQYEKGYADGKAERDEQIEPIWDDTDKCYCCGKCGGVVVFLWEKEEEFRKTYKYCTSCGQAVKWECISIA